jgi:hypothetical protein
LNSGATGPSFDAGGRVITMEVLYDSESFAVVQLDWPTGEGRPDRGGYEIVDKLARQDIFLEGLVAEGFKAGVQALLENAPSQEDFDTFIEGYAELGRQPLTLH